MTVSADIKTASDDEVEDRSDDVGESPEPSQAELESDGDTPDGEDEAAEPDALRDVESDSEPTWKRRALIGAVITICIGALTASGILGWMVYQDRQLARASHDAQQAAITYAQILTSIDSNRLDENFQQVLDGATGEFKDMYSQSSVQLRQLLIDNNAAAHGVVVDSAVQSATANTVVVLLFVDQSVSNAAVPDPRIDRSRIRMTMEFVDNRWRASKVELP